MTTVKLSELLFGFDFVNVDSALSCDAYLDLERGTIHCISDEFGIEEDTPDDLYSERYLAIPTKKDLNLGRTLALAFAADFLADDYDKVVAYFRKAGAYAKFKKLAENKEVIVDWHNYENKAIESALRQWCTENNIQVMVDNG